MTQVTKRDMENEYCTCLSPWMSNHSGKNKRNSGNSLWRKVGLGVGSGEKWPQTTLLNASWRLPACQSHGVTEGIYHLLCRTWLQEVLSPWNTSHLPFQRWEKEINPSWSRDGEDILEFKDKHQDFPIRTGHLFSERNEVTLLAQASGSNHWPQLCSCLALLSLSLTWHLNITK